MTSRARKAAAPWSRWTLGALAVLAMAAGVVAEGHAYTVAPGSTDNVVHLRLDDRSGTTDGLELGAVIESAPEWFRLTGTTVDKDDVALRFDVSDVALGTRGHLKIRLVGTEQGAVELDHTHWVSLQVRGIVEQVQQSFRIDECCTEIIGVEDASVTPAAFMLVGNTPNPVRTITSVVFGLPEGGGVVDMKIYDIQGRLVRNLTTPRLSGGFHQITWDGADSGGRQVAPGAYFYRLSSGSWTETRKLQVIR